MPEPETQPALDPSRTRSRVGPALSDAPEPGDPAPSLLETLYDTLRSLAHAHLRSRAPGALLQTTVVVHEAWLRLRRYDESAFASRAAYLGAASRVMRTVLIDEARRQGAAMRGKGWRRVALEPLADGTSTHAADLIDLDAALDELAAVNPRWVRVVELRFFAGLGVRETAEALGVGERSVELDWRASRAWLRARLDRGRG
ncbi:MAG TPA: ECF-type sigma factor [Phycisphaerales bacterium]|nr:ECF-type sigma factor [Phycisphaerales bacterium]